MKIYNRLVSELGGNDGESAASSGSPNGGTNYVKQLSEVDLPDPEDYVYAASAPVPPGRLPRAGPMGTGRRQHQQADEREPHARHERVWLGMVVGIQPDDRLQQRRRELEGEGDQADGRSPG